MAASPRKAARRWRGPRSRSLARMRGISASGEAASDRGAERPLRPPPGGLRLHAPVVADVPVPLLAQVVHRAARRVRDPRLRHEAGRKAREPSPAGPSPCPRRPRGRRSRRPRRRPRGAPRGSPWRRSRGGRWSAPGGTRRRGRRPPRRSAGRAPRRRPRRRRRGRRRPDRRRRRRGSPPASRDRGCSRHRGRRRSPPAPGRRRDCAPAPVPAAPRARDARRGGRRPRRAGSGVEPLSTTRTSKRSGARVCSPRAARQAASGPAG